MKAAVYHDQTDIRIEEVPVPRIRDDEILVDMKACGLCGSDLMDWYLRPRAPLVLGHEPAGTVAKKGSRVRNLKVGDRVFVHHHAACLTCHFCLRGDYTLCSQFHETNIEPGGFSEHFRVPAPNVQVDTLKLPETLSFEEATLIEPVACCIRALNKSGLRPGDTVAVIGAGPTGLIHTLLSKIYGASKTIVLDTVSHRLNVAEQFGADATVNPETENPAETVKHETQGTGADFAVVTAPSIQAYETALTVCRKGGTLVAFAPTRPDEHFTLSPEKLFFSELTIIPSYSTSHLETRAALQLLASHRLNAEQLITHRFNLQHTDEAFNTALRNKKSLKIIISN